jgi:hypothetical protein
MNVNARDRFMEWLESPKSQADVALREKAVRFEDRYFADMTLRAFSKKLSKAEIGGCSVSDGFDFNITISEWIIRHDDNLDEGVEGTCDLGEREILVRTGPEEDICLMHEMIHAYEGMLAASCEHYRQFIIIELFRKLNKKIKGLHNLIARDVNKYAMVHTPLFILKSLDLDLRMKRPLGTVYDYGRAETFRKHDRRKK